MESGGAAGKRNQGRGEHMDTQSVVCNLVPGEMRCEWCGKEAVSRCTALSGPHHRQSGYFCSSCVEMLLQAVPAGAQADGKSEPGYEQDEDDDIDLFTEMFSLWR